MQITKTVTVKIMSVAPVKVRTSQKGTVPSTPTPGHLAPRTSPGPVNVPSPVADGYQITLASVDDAGHVDGRANITLCNGALSSNAAPLGTAPASLVAAMSNLFSEIDKSTSDLLTSKKISL